MVPFVAYALRCMSCLVNVIIASCVFQGVILFINLIHIDNLWLIQVWHHFPHKRRFSVAILNGGIQNFNRGILVVEHRVLILDFELIILRFLLKIKLSLFDVCARHQILILFSVKLIID